MDHKHDGGYLSALRINRAQAFQLLLLAVVLGVGVNLLASDISDRVSVALRLALALILVLTALSFLLGRLLWPKSRERTFRGFFLYDRSTGLLAAGDMRYELGYYLKHYLDAAFAENQAVKAVWEKNPLSELSIPDKHKRQNDPNKSLELVRQAAEYFVLNSFSTCLSDHFRSNEYADQKLDTLSHTDIPDVLLQNRFMRIFAEPMENRAAFLDEPDSDTPRSAIVIAEASSGAFYERFELVLPKGWKVKRSANNRIEVFTRKFTLIVGTECPGYGVTLPASYGTDYLQLGPMFDQQGLKYSALQIDVSIQIIPRRTWLLSPRGWHYYQWIDEWIDQLEPNVSLDDYLVRIGWETAETTLLMLKPSSAVTPVEDPSDVTEDGAANSGQFDSGHRFGLGDRVEHATFGEGQVVGIEVGGIALVHFEGDPEDKVRKLMWDYAPIRIIEQ